MDLPNDPAVLRAETADLQRRLRQAESLARVHLGQAWQREDTTQAQLQQAQQDLQKVLDHDYEAMRVLAAERDKAKRDVGVAWGMYNSEETRLIRALRDAADQRALAEERNDALNASAPYLLGTGVPNDVLKQVGLARRIAPAEAQEEGD